MSDACYTARVNTADQVTRNIAKLTLTKNQQGQYNHEDGVTFAAGIKRVLNGTFNAREGTKNGMADLLIKDSELSKIKSTDTLTATDVLNEYKAKAVAESKAAGAVIVPTITVRSDAQSRRG